jgi:hypothetical protein
MTPKQAVQLIKKNGILLVFPENNKKDPKSLWSEFYPRSQMTWDWNVDGDRRVEKLWRLMKEISDGRQVVYSKWCKGRATFFSRELFTALLRLRDLDQPPPLSRTSGQILDLLLEDSPLSTKQLKALAELQGKDNERIYTRSMKELFEHFYIVAFGEVDDGAFPSLAVGATASLYEDLVEGARSLSRSDAQAVVDGYLPAESSFGKFLRRYAPTEARVVKTKCIPRLAKNKPRTDLRSTAIP